MATFDPRRLLMFAVRVLEPHGANNRVEPIVGNHTRQRLRREKKNHRQERTESGHVDW
jgi:hypothetical protein